MTKTKPDDLRSPESNENIAHSLQLVHTSSHLQNYITNPVNKNAKNATMIRINEVTPEFEKDFCYDLNLQIGIHGGFARMTKMAKNDLESPFLKPK